MVQGRTGVSTQMDARTHLASWRGQEHSEKQVALNGKHISSYYRSKIYLILFKFYFYNNFKVFFLSYFY